MTTRDDPHHYEDTITGATMSAEIARTRSPEDVKRIEGWPHPEEPEPSDEQIEAWMFDSICEATDGCTIEPDGICEHGHPSWLLRKGLV